MYWHDTRAGCLLLYQHTLTRQLIPLDHAPLAVLPWFQQNIFIHSSVFCPEMQEQTAEGRSVLRAQERIRTSSRHAVKNIPSIHLSPPLLSSPLPLSLPSSPTHIATPAHLHHALQYRAQFLAVNNASAAAAAATFKSRSPSSQRSPLPSIVPR